MVALPLQMPTEKAVRQLRIKLMVQCAVVSPCNSIMEPTETRIKDRWKTTKHTNSHDVVSMHKMPKALNLHIS